MNELISFLKNLKINSPSSTSEYASNRVVGIFILFRERCSIAIANRDRD